MCSTTKLLTFWKYVFFFNWIFGRWQCRVSRTEDWTCLAEDLRKKIMKLVIVTMTSLYIKQTIQNKIVSKASRNYDVREPQETEILCNRLTKRLYRKSSGNQPSVPMAPLVPIFFPPFLLPISHAVGQSRVCWFIQNGLLAKTIQKIEQKTRT